MVASRRLWAIAFAALGVTSVFWFWVVLSLLAVHWPNNGQQIAAIPLLLAGLGILGYGLVSTLSTLLGRSAQSMAPSVLEGVSIASLVVILGAGVFLVTVGNGVIGVLPDLVISLVGLGGSVAATVLYESLRRRDRVEAARQPPARPDPSGNSA